MKTRDCVIYFVHDCRRTADKILHDRAFNIAENPKYDGCQKGLPSMVYKCFDKKPSGGTVKNENISNKELAEELQKPIIRNFEKRPIIRNFEKRTVQTPFIDKIWGANLADMQLISKSYKELTFLSSVIDICSKYAGGYSFKR